jgi:parvulin-like peptidyl-prolyl isomerase
MLGIVISLTGCGKIGPKSKEDIVACVNNDVIYKSDLKRDIALRAKLDPTFKVTPETESEQLDVIINRKLIIQEAMQQGLARDERFVNAIRTIWEQTLIRDFLDYKRARLQDFLFATEDDINKYYNNLSQKVTFRVLKSRNRHAVDEAYKKYREDKDTSIWQTVGPIGYEDITSSVLLEAFEMNKGEARKFDDEPNYYIVEVLEKEKVEIAPLETLKPEIEKRTISLKAKRLFDDWLKEKRKNSRITIKRTE